MSKRISKPLGPVVLCILDGWGLRQESADNAIELAVTPNWDRMTKDWPVGKLKCAGEDVGLPAGQMGNSEVGHLNIGAGRIVWQDFPRINRTIEDGSLASAPPLTKFIDALRFSGGTCHLIGLISSGGVHAHQDHVIVLAGIIAKSGVPVRIHAITDGRDTPPRSAVQYLAEVESAISAFDDVSIATVCGRYFAMDRDRRWSRVARAYDLIVSGQGAVFECPVSAPEASYAEGVSDEFMKPARHQNYRGMKDGDAVLHANFRADRVRELLSALVDPNFGGFTRTRTVSLAAALGMVTYSEELSRFCGTIFAPIHLKNTLGEIAANAGLRQLRAAETEKHAHVTYFLNGGVEKPFEGEDRILVQSPKVTTYDLQPEMSARELTSKLVEAIASGKYHLVLINYGNGDMVGHTGCLEAAIKAVECVDECLGQLEEAVVGASGTMLVTSDHGNCETMFDSATGMPHTAHTLNPVPVVLVNSRRDQITVRDGRLADVAPTILDLLGIEQPDEMTGSTLVVSK